MLIDGGCNVLGIYIINETRVLYYDVVNFVFSSKIHFENGLMIFIPTVSDKILDHEGLKSKHGKQSAKLPNELTPSKSDKVWKLYYFLK